MEFGIKHQTIWKFYIQSKYLATYLTKYITIPPVVRFLQVTRLFKTRRVVNLFLNIAGAWDSFVLRMINGCTSPLGFPYVIMLTFRHLARKLDIDIQEFHKKNVLAPAQSSK